MPITLDLDADLAYVDGVESVTVRLNRPSGSREYTTALAVMGDLTKALRSFGAIELNGRETAWHLPDLLPTGDLLGPEDEIVTSTGTQTVVDAVHLPLDAGWIAIARPRPGGG